MMRRVLTAALLAGLVAGLVVSLAQTALVLPLIHLAEYLETGGAMTAYGAPGPLAIVLDDPLRFAGTAAFNVMGGVAFALLTAAAMTAAGRPLGWLHGLAWGLAGWAVASLAPAISQPPLPPGSTFVDLEARQVWWLATVAVTALALALAVFAQAKPLKALGFALLLAPHLLGAPGTPEDVMAAPFVARNFALASLASTLAFWLVLGGMLGHLLPGAGKGHT